MKRLRAVAAAVAAFGVCVPLAFADVQFESAVSIGVAHTDNLTLAAEDKQSETIYQLSPSFRLSQQSARFTSNAAYQMEGYDYDSFGETEVHNRFDGAISIALDPENFFFELGANRAQSIRDPQLAIPRSNLPISQNRVDRDSAWAGPAFEYPVGENVSVAGSYRRSWIRYDDEQLDEAFGFTRDADSDTFAFSVDNYRRERGLTWAVRYDRQKTDYGVFMPWEYRQAALELGGWAAPGLRFFASAGRESAWDEPFDSSLEDDFWEAGLSKSVGERFSAEVAAGERTFGSSKRGQLDFVFGRGSTAFSYVESPTTQERNPYDAGGLIDPDLPENFLFESGSAERFVLKRLQWSATFALRRVDFALNVFDETREDRARLDGTPLDDLAQSGASIQAEWRVGVRTGLTFGVSRADREYEADDELKLTAVSLGATYDVGPRTVLSLELSRAKEDSQALTAGTRDYAADLVSLLLTRTF